MFYVQDWNSMFPDHSALEIFQHQLIGIKKSIQYYDSSSEIRNDCYILNELTKIKELTYLIQDHLTNLRANPKNAEAVNFLFRGDIKKLPVLQSGIKIFDQLEKAVLSRIEKIDEEFVQLSSQVKDSSFQMALKKIKNFSKESKGFYESNYGLSALKVVDVFSKYIHPDQLKKIKALEALEKTDANAQSLLNQLSGGVDKLRLEIAKDLRSGKHKLYYCTFEKGISKQAKEARLSFLVEKTPEDNFRLYQSSNSHFSLKSFLLHEMEKHQDALLTYTEFYPLLKNLQSMEYAKKWDSDFNQMYKDVFKVDYKDFLGEAIDQDAFKLRYMSLDILENEFDSAQQPSFKTKVFDQLNVFVEDGKYVGIGASIGAMTALVGTISWFATRSILGL